MGFPAERAACSRDESVRAGGGSRELCEWIRTPSHYSMRSPVVFKRKITVAGGGDKNRCVCATGSGSGCGGSRSNERPAPARLGRFARGTEDVTVNVRRMEGGERRSRRQGRPPACFVEQARSSPPSCGRRASARGRCPFRRGLPSRAAPSNSRGGQGRIRPTTARSRGPS